MTTTAAQEAAIAGANESRSGLFEAQENLLVALRRPQPGREWSWAKAVALALRQALLALEDYRLEVEGGQGLYAHLLREAPWAAPRLRQITAQLGRIEGEATDVQIEAARVEAGDLQALSTIRAEAERILLSLRDLLSKEADLIYERFRDPPALD